MSHRITEEVGCMHRACRLEVQRVYRFDCRGWAVLVVIGILLAGCSRGTPKSVDVSGTVTYHGKPVEHAAVLFVSAKTRSTEGKTDAQGRFNMKALLAGNGATADEQIVCITKTVADPTAPNGTPYSPKRHVLPLRYASPVQSPLKAAVTGKGPNDFRFDLAD